MVNGEEPSPRPRSDRKESVTGGQYEGSISNLPMRGITQSMVNGEEPSPRPRSDRKESVTGGQHEGSISNLPIRGITQSMVNGEEPVEEKKPVSFGNSRSMMSFALAQRMRAFEGN